MVAQHDQRDTQLRTGRVGPHPVREHRTPPPGPVEGFDRCVRPSKRHIEGPERIPLARAREEHVGTMGGRVEGIEELQ